MITNAFVSLRRQPLYDMPLGHAHASPGTAAATPGQIDWAILEGVRFVTD